MISHSGDQFRSTERPRWDWNSVALACLAVVVWILCHPYRGIVHDNRIYALLALNFNDARGMGEDLFLKHGSQDSFTLFSPIYAWWISLLGLDVSNRILVGAGQALWILGAFALIRTVLSPRFSWLALLFLAAYPPYYGGDRIFSIGEGFLSPRLFAEALALAALAAFLSRRFGVCFLLLIMGGVLHPLMMAGPAGVIVTLTLLRRQPWWMAFPVVGGATALLLAVLAAGHLAGVAALPVIDPAWKFIVENRTQQAVLFNWAIEDWLQIACDVLLVSLACLKASPALRRFLVTIIAVALASLLVSFVAFDLLNDLLVGKTQVWRAVWMLHVLAPISLALVVQEASAVRSAERSLLLVLGCGMAAAMPLSFAAYLSSIGLSLGVLLAVTYVSTLSNRMWTSRERRLVWFVFGTLLVLIAAKALWLVALDMNPLLSGLRDPLLRFMLAALVTALGGALLLTPVMVRQRKMLAALAVLAFGAMVLQWDQRGVWRRYLDSTPDISRDLPISIAPTEQVYWPGDVMMLWGVLRNPSFYSNVQGAGVVFNRQTALDYLERLKLVALFEPPVFETGILLDKKHFWSSPDASPGLADLVALCSRPLHPDVVVLGEHIPGTQRKSWRSPQEFVRAYLPPDVAAEPENIVVQRISEYFFYRCDDVLRTHAPEQGATPDPPSL